MTQDTSIPANSPPTLAQDPLAQLQDIHLPDPVGIWPLAWGWWALMIAVVVCLWVSVSYIRRAQSRRAYRQQTLLELHKIRATFNHEQTAEYLQAVTLLLRRCAISGFGHQFNTGLKGDEWLAWLGEQCHKTQHEFNQGIGRVLLVGPYQKKPTFDRDALHQLIVCWVSEHRNQWQQKASSKHYEAKHDV